MIKVKKLSKTFASGIRAVDGIDMHVRPGEIMGLLGPNGAGKTTIIRVLSTLCGFDSGNVKIADFDLDRDPNQIRHSIGYVAQQTGVDFFLTGRENLLLQGQMYHMPAKQIIERLNQLAEYFNFNEYLDQTVKTYSGGIRRKLDIATALIQNPKVIFLDEPTLGLDIHSRNNLWQLIKRLNTEQNLTILLTTHHLEEADKLAHRVSIINKGKIVVCDTPARLKSQILGEALILQFEQKNAAVAEFESTLSRFGFIKDKIWDDDALHLYVEHGTSALTKIVSEATKANIKIINISLAQPSLDDVFLKYTGTSFGQNSDAEEGEPWWKQWAGKSGGNWNKGQQAKWQETQQDSEKNEKDDAQWQNQEEKKEKEQGDWQKWQDKEKKDQGDWKQWQDNSDKGKK